eukprot:11178248-Lingulodinium_polyedra.AAC.1
MQSRWPDHGRQTMAVPWPASGQQYAPTQWSSQWPSTPRPRDGQVMANQVPMAMRWPINVNSPRGHSMASQWPFTH